MSLEEIMSEKIRAIIYSPQPRHLYDIWYLLNKKITVNPELINKKIALYNKEFNFDTFVERINGLKKDWEVDLNALLPQNPPIFDKVSNIVTNAVLYNFNNKDR